jgi:hypothetical protein
MFLVDLPQHAVRLFRIDGLQEVVDLGSLAATVK